MLKWVLIVLGLGLVFGPVLWMMPSAAQSRQAKLRTRASQLGLQVKIADMPQVHRARVRKQDTLSGAMYMLRHPPRHQRQSWLVCRERGAGWDTETLATAPLPQRKVLQAILPQLAADVYAFEENPQGIAMYWREQGDESAVDTCLAYLQQLAQA